MPINADKIIGFLKENERITNRQGREITGLSATRVKVFFKDLCDKRLIVAHGVNRDRFYNLIENHHFNLIIRFLNYSIGQHFKDVR